jgi:hypothetical protein
MFSRSLAIVGAIGACLSAAPVLSQEPPPEFIALGSGGFGWSTEADLRWPTGLIVRMGFARVEVGYERLTDSRTYVGVTCGGFVPPDVDCGRESIESSGEHKGFYIAVRSFERRWGRMRATLLPEVGLVRFTVARRGIRSGRSLDDEETAVNLGVGARGSYQVLRRIPIDVVVGLSWRMQFKPSFLVDDCLDCRQGFNGLGMLVFSVGLQLAVRR